MRDIGPKIFCAIDTASLETARALVAGVGPITRGIKLGMEFFNTFGPSGVEDVMSACPQASLFIDLKFHDIPNTVAGTVRTLSKRLRPAYLNVHAAGGATMMKAARDACEPETKLLAVTVLTSLSHIELGDTGIDSPPLVQVERLARLAYSCGLDGVVCSAEEIATLRTKFGPDFTLMVPGIRPEGSDVQDQKRVMTPEKALEAGATHLVIGRPITGADDPVAAAQKIVDSITSL